MDLLLLVFVWAFVRTIYIHRNGLSLFLFPPPKKKETNKAHIPLKSSSFPKKNIDTIIIINLYRLARIVCTLATLAIDPALSSFPDAAKTPLPEVTKYHCLFYDT